jgi:hypothetical protein
MDELHEYVAAADAMAGTVHLLDGSGQWLHAALVGGSPPAIYLMPRPR